MNDMEIRLEIAKMAAKGNPDKLNFDRRFDEIAAKVLPEKPNFDDLLKRWKKEPPRFINRMSEAYLDSIFASQVAIGFDPSSDMADSQAFVLRLDGESLYGFIRKKMKDEDRKRG